MPLDFRYHLASLTAVFGALLIGILLGVAITDAPGLSGQINALRKEFRKSEVLRDIDKRTDQFNQRTQEALVRDRLLGRNIALVINSYTFPADQVDPIRQALEQAGATVTVEVTLKPAMLDMTAEQITKIYQRMEVIAPEKPGTQDLMHRLALDLGRGWSVIVPVLQKQGVIRIKGDIATPISTVIYLGGSRLTADDSLQLVEMPFLRGCVERQLRIAAVEPLGISRSAMSTYQKVAPITVDNIDRAAGRISLVVALANNRPGHYGYKNTADDVSPDIE